MMVNKYLLNEQTDKVLIIVAVYTYVKSFDVSIASQVRKEEREKKKKRRVMESKCPGGNPGSS